MDNVEFYGTKCKIEEILGCQYMMLNCHVNYTTVNSLISAHGRLDFLGVLGWALIRDVRLYETCAYSLNTKFMIVIFNKTKQLQ